MPWELANLFRQGVQSGSRSTVVSTLGWMAVVLGSCIIGAVRVQAAPWIPEFFAGLFAIDFLTFIGLYIYFALTNPEALRSERYSIQKLAIERHLLGDSTVGLFEELNPPQPKIQGPSNEGEN